MHIWNILGKTNIVRRLKRTKPFDLVQALDILDADLSA